MDLDLKPSPQSSPSPALIADDLNDCTTIVSAAIKHHPACIDRLINEGADVNVRSQNNYTALAIAARRGCEHSVNSLIKAGANVNPSGDCEYFPLFFAVERGHKNCVRLLTDAGADVNIFIEDFTCFTTCLIEAVQRNFCECVKLLIHSGANVNVTYCNLRTPILMAASTCCNECLRMLIQAGAKVNTPDAHGNTALIMGSGNKTVSPAKQLQCISLLLKAGAHINRFNMFYRNALDEHFTECQPPRKEVAVLLFASGEMSELTAGQDDVKVPEYVVNSHLKLCLKHLCREAIRHRLIDLNSRLHLFSRIPELGLPSLLNEYLLYEQSLD